MLDHEALTCLLVLLFVDEPRINTARLHRVLRNLCYHGPTRSWIIHALLSILQKTGECRIDSDCRLTDKSRKKSQSSQPMQTDCSVSVKSDTKHQAPWLSISLEAALGCRANVFHVQRTSKKHSAGQCSVVIHAQAAPVVCRHSLDTLIALAKSFPSQFLPNPIVKEGEKSEEDKTSEIAKFKPTSVVTDSNRPCANRLETDFWDILVKLDSASSSKKGKGVQRLHSNFLADTEFVSTTFDHSPLGQLMTMLSYSVIQRSQLLTDRLLRLLGIVSIGLPEDVKSGSEISRVSGQITRTSATSSLSARSAGITSAPCTLASPIVTPPVTTTCVSHVVAQATLPCSVALSSPVVALTPLTIAPNATVNVTTTNIVESSSLTASTNSSSAINEPLVTSTPAAVNLKNSTEHAGSHLNVCLQSSVI